MSLDAPSPPDANATAAGQQQYNQRAAQSQAEMNMVNQRTPFGSLSYRQTGTNADGTPIFSATTQLSPQEQALFDTGLSTQQTMAGEAGALARSLGPSLSHGPNLGNDSLVNTLMGWQSKYMHPIFSQQQSNLNSQLAAEGITQDSPAYVNAQRSLNQSQSGTMENAMAQDEGQAFNQSAEAYQLPIQTLSTLLGGSQPGNLNASFMQTPQEQIQPANYESLVQQNYQDQLHNQQNSMAGIFGLGSALAGGWARSGFMLPSDRRLKTDIDVVGLLFDGTPVYRFRYIDDPRAMQIGVMAQDILIDRPDAVGFRDDGMMMVDYRRATDRAAELAHG